MNAHDKGNPLKSSSLIQGLRKSSRIGGFSLAILLSSAVWASPVVVADGETYNDDIESRNDPVTINRNATVNGQISTRNAIISIGDEAKVGAVESRNGQVTVGERVEAEAITTRNGSIDVGSRSIVGSIDTRNGRIRIADDGSTGSIGSRNGAVSVGSGVAVGGWIETRNGDIDVGSDSQIAGRIETRNANVFLGVGTRVSEHTETRNGNISLDSAEVLKHIKTRYGNIHVDGQSIVGGDVIIEIVHNAENSTWGNWSLEFSDGGEIVIETGSVVAGNIIVLLDEDFDAEPPKVTIERGARIEGSVRVDSRTDLTVDGEVVGRIERIDA